MRDLTVIMLTANKVPATWAAYHRQVLCDAIGDAPLITVSFQPLDWGVNLLQTEYGVTNLFRQILRGAELADTPYVAVAEDDTLYTTEHFAFRPPPDRFAYDYNRWQAFTWARHPFYFHKPSPANGLMIAPRALVVNALRARLAAHPELVGYVAKELGTSIHARQFDGGTMMAFYGGAPVISLVHPESVDNLSQRRRKVPWPVQAYDIPAWGRADHVVRRFA